MIVSFALLMLGFVLANSVYTAEITMAPAWKLKNWCFIIGGAVIVVLGTHVIHVDTGRLLAIYGLAVALGEFLTIIALGRHTIMRFWIRTVLRWACLISATVTLFIATLPKP